MGSTGTAGGGGTGGVSELSPSAGRALADVIQLSEGLL